MILSFPTFLYSLIILRFSPSVPKVLLSNFLIFASLYVFFLYIYYSSYFPLKQLNSFESIYFPKHALALPILFLWYGLMSTLNLCSLLCDIGQHRLRCNVRAPAVTEISSRSPAALVWLHCSHLPGPERWNSNSWLSWTEAMLICLVQVWSPCWVRWKKGEKNLKKKVTEEMQETDSVLN